MPCLFLSCNSKAYCTRAILVATTTVLRRWNDRWHMEVCATGYCLIVVVRTTRLSLDDCRYKCNTKRYRGACARARVAAFSPWTPSACGSADWLYLYRMVFLPVSGVPRNFFRGGSTNSVWGQRERGSGGGSPLVRGSGGSCNFVQEISFHIVKFSQFLVL